MVPLYVAPFLGPWTGLVNCCWLMTLKAGLDEAVQLLSGSLWKICFWNAPSWSQWPHRKCDYSEMTILWSIWGGLKVWSIMERERERERGSLRLQTCEWGRDAAALAADPESPRWCHEQQRWSIRLSSSRIPNPPNHGKINGWFKPLSFGIPSYVAGDNWNITYRNV